MEEWMQSITSDTNWQKLIQLMTDKQLAIRVLRKQKELFLKDDTMKVYEKHFDPTKGLVDFVNIYENVDRKVMESLGLDHHVKDWTNFKLMKMIMPLYMGDPEIMAELDHMVHIGNPMMPPDVGATRQDMELVAIDTKRCIPLSQLHSRKNQPLVIIASSLS